MMRRSIPTALVALSLVAAAGCGGSADEEAPARPVATATATATAEPMPMATEVARRPERKRDGTTIKTGDSQFGTVLFDGRSQAIYLFDKEKGSTPDCYGECAEAWPPVLTDGEPVARGTVKQSLLGTTRRRDGSTQVTYNGHPLYYYAHEGPNQVLCHNVPGFGGLWLALAPDGDRVS